MSLLSLSPEILTQILKDCSTLQEVFAFVSTCQRLYSIWIAHANPIIWDVGRRSIVVFDDALMAVRATEIVRQACERDELPPHPFPLLELSGKARKPNLTEMKAVFDFQHFVRCIEYQILHVNRWSDFNTCLDSIPWNEPDTNCDAWRTNLFRCLYRTILIAATLTRSYMEPFLLATKANDIGFIERWEHWPEGESISMDDDDPEQIAEQDLENIRQYPMYNFDADDASEEGILRDDGCQEAFGHLSSWLVEDAKTRPCPLEIFGRGASRAVSKSRAAYADGVGDTSRLFAAYLHISSRLSNSDRKAHHDRDELSEKFSTPTGHVRKVSVVLFGIFQVEEITMPVKIEDCATLHLTAEITFKERDYPDVAMILDKVFLMSSRPDLHDGWRTPRGMFRFFAFTARRYQDLRFHEEAFAEFGENGMNSIMRPETFRPGEVGSMFQEYSNPVLSHSEPGMREYW